MIMEETDNRKSVCIIGAGLSGLTCGMRLARAGFKVTVVEELASPGGLLSYTRIGREYLELTPHHLRKSDRSLLALIKEMGVEDKISWFDSTWQGRASQRKVGYFDGGFSCLISSLAQEITDHGGRICFSTTVAEISRLGSGEYRTVCVLPNSTRFVIDSTYVIFTGSCRTFVNVSHGLPIPMDNRDIMMNVTYSAKISAFMVLKHENSQMFYQQMTTGSDIPFDRIINHTSCFGQRGYGGSVVYLVGSCQVADPIWIASDADIMQKFFTAYKKLYRSIRKSDVKSWRVTKIRYAQSEPYPGIDLTNPCENLYVCSTGLAKYNNSETPENRMELAVSLAGKICSMINAKEAQSANEVLSVTEVTSLAREIADLSRS
ncbi:MAG: FAD-dependent oxidoreductase [Clostridiales bacterium]|nr:FAD-dependent oxidoreductase [Clostridiales bacterium]